MRPLSEQTPDPLEEEKALRRTLRAGVTLTLGFLPAYVIYALLTWDRPHRWAMVALFPVMGSLSLLLKRFVPVEALVARGLDQPFLVAWSSSLTLCATLMALADGGARSPLVATLFLPLVFAASGYRARLTAMVSGIVVLAYATIVARTPDPELARSVFTVQALLVTSAICAWQAANHERRRADLARASRTDPLTGCLNRRGFEQTLGGELTRCVREHGQLGLVLIDLDHFKAVNDRHGHAAGDELLCWVVERAQSVLAPEAALGRLGGDEFAALLPGADTREAAEVAARLRAALAERAPASTGVAALPAHGTDGDRLLRHADAQLYAAKTGRVAAAA